MSCPTQTNLLIGTRKNSVWKYATSKATGLRSPQRARPVLHLCETTPLEPGNTGIAFQVDDLDKAYKEMSGKGVEFTVKPKKEEWGYHAMFKDPDGNEFWLFGE